MSDPDKVQSEIEALSNVYKHKLILKEQIKIQRLRNIHLLDEEKYISTITRYYDSGGTEKTVDDYYFDAFINYRGIGLRRFNRTSSIDRLPFDFGKIFSIAEHMPLSKKMQLADVLKAKYSKDHYIKAFELFKELMRSELYSRRATVGILELFYQNRNLYDANIELLPNLNDPQLSDRKNSDIREAAYRVYARYCLQEKAVELLASADFCNYLNQHEPSSLLELYFTNSNTDLALEFAREAIYYAIQDDDYEELAHLILVCKENGFGPEIDQHLPKDNPIVKRALDEVHI